MSKAVMPEEVPIAMLSNVFIHYIRPDETDFTNDDRCMSSVPNVGDIVYPEEDLGPYRVRQVDFHPWRSPRPSEDPLPYAEDVEIWLEPTTDSELPRNTVKWNSDVRELMERVLGEVVARPTDLEVARLLARVPASDKATVEEMSIRAKLEAHSRSCGYQP